MRLQHRSWVAVILIVLTASLLAPHMAMADFIKLSGTMPATGDVLDFQISPDGQYVVYRADQDTDEAVELYSVPLAGGTPVRLNPALPSGSAVQSDYKISADSSRVVYRADQDSAGVIELYSVPLAGPSGAAVKISGALVTDGGVLAFAISRDSGHVVYRADQDTYEVQELYSVPLTGGASVKLNEVLPTGRNVGYDFQISPDSSRVAYRADQDTAGVPELYSVPLAGPASEGVKLNGTLAADGFVWDEFTISPDSSRVVYKAKETGDQEHELYSAPLVGGTPVKLNKTLVSGGYVWSWWISPDSSRVVYQAEQDTDEVWEVYSVPMAGPASDGVKLNKTLVTGGGSGGLRISPDSSRVVYRADQDTDQMFEIYSVPLAGPASEGVKLNQTLVAGGWVGYDFVISPDSSRVVYRADQDTDQVFEIYSVPLNGPASAGVKLNGALPPDGDVEIYGFAISPDSSRVVYRADQDSDGTVEIYSVPLDGPTSAGVKLNGALATGGSVADFEISPDSAHTVYLADQDTDDVSELYAAALESRYAIYLPLIVRSE